MESDSASENETECRPEPYYSLLLRTSTETIELITCSRTKLEELLMSEKSSFSYDNKDKPTFYPNTMPCNTTDSKVISYTASCFFPTPCTLSTDKDPLLNRIKTTFDSLSNVLLDSMPDMKHKFIEHDFDSSTFTINRPEWHSHDSCSFTNIYNSPTDKTIFLEQGLKQTQLAGAKFLEGIKSKNPNFNDICNPLVFLCYESGNCNLLTIYDLFEVIKRRIYYIYDNSVIKLNYQLLERYLHHIIQAKSNLRMLIQTNPCDTISIYGDHEENYAVSPQVWNEPIHTLLRTPHAYFYDNLNQTLIKWSENTVNSSISYDQAFQRINFKNNMLFDHEPTNEIIEVNAHENNNEYSTLYLYRWNIFAFLLFLGFAACCVGVVLFAPSLLALWMFCVIFCFDNKNAKTK